MPAIKSAFVKLDPRTLIKQSRHVRRRSRDDPDNGHLHPRSGHRRRKSRLHVPDYRVALVHGVCLQISPKRSPKGEARRRRMHCARREPRRRRNCYPARTGKISSWYPGTKLKVGDVVLVEAGDTIPSDGEVIEGIASVNESAITGKSAPVIRESGGDRSAVTGGTEVLSDWIRVRDHGCGGFDLHRPHDQAGRRGRATENTQRNRAQHSARRTYTDLRVRDGDDTKLRWLCWWNGAGRRSRRIIRYAHPDHHRRSPFRDRHCRHGSACPFQCFAMSGRAVEAAGDVDTLLLDKTGTITLGNRQATAFKPLSGVTAQDLRRRPSLRHLPMRRPRAARSSCWRRKNMVSVAGTRRK